MAYVPCCREGGSAAVIGPAGGRNEKEQLLLPGYGCGGDTSRWCCNISLDGQTVVATGTLHPNIRGGRPDEWQLDGATFCEPASQSHD